jgi:single-strand DNA-binding protein
MATTQKETDNTSTNTSTDADTETDAEAGKLPTEVCKVGNLTRDPELRFSEKGTVFSRFAIAVSQPVTPGDWAGERSTEFYEVTAFGSLAEHVAESLRKGDRAVVSGRPELESFTAKDGTEKTQKRILAEAVGAELRFATCSVTRATRHVAPNVPRSGDEQPF